MVDYVVDTASHMASNATAVLSAPVHPYSPHDAIIPGYEANEWSVPALLGVFFGACTILFASTYFVAKKVNNRLTNGELVTIMWFVLSGAIHLFFEGHYVFNYATLGAKQTLIGQMWKEYAFSDSRYLTKNTFVLSVEGITVLFWGPGCLLVASLIVLRHPMRYPLQATISMGQLCGDALYYATSALDFYLNKIEYSRPEAFYFWFYFVAMNAIWIVVPAYLIYQSATQCAKAIAKVQQLEASKKAS